MNLKTMKTQYLVTILLICSIGNISILAQQSELRKSEVGGFVTTLNLHSSVYEKPAGIGGRFTYNINENVAIDAEFAHFPANPSGNFGESQAVVGIKAGIRKEKFGVFAKARPGMINFGGEYFKQRYTGDRKNLMVDVGGVFEYYPSSRVILRVDVGDSLISYGNDTLLSVYGVPEKHKTTHNLQTTFGIGFRF